MLKATLRSLFAHKIRMALTGVAIVLGVAFVAGTWSLPTRSAAPSTSSSPP
jgi:hypothetical protein